MNHRLAILAATGAGFAMPCAFAADQQLDQIIVTGARAPIAVAEAGSAVTIITREDIDRRQARYVSDLLRAVPGFAVSHTGVVGSQTQVRVRGSEANHVLVLIDGVRANDPATGDEFRWEYLSTADVARIEVVRGPQSALWGSEAVGGVVHIITHAGAESSGGSAYIEAGSENTLNGALSGRFGGERWSMGLGFEQLKTDGFNVSRSGNENDDADIETASLNVHLSPSDAVELSLAARRVDAYSQFDAVDYAVTGLPADSDVATDTRQTFAQLGATFGPAEGRVRHHLKAHYFDSDNRNLVDGRYDSRTSADRTRVGYQADISLAENRLTFALEHETTRFAQRGPIVFDDPNQDQEAAVASVVADYQGRLTGNVTWLMGLRYDDHSDFEDIATGRVAVAWRVGESTTLRASAGTGHKTPTFIERFGYFSQSFVGNPSLKPEHSTSFDLGLDRNFASFGLQISVFEQDLDDEINGYVCPNPWPAPCTATNMDGSSTRRGVETALQWQVMDRFAVGATYTYTHTEDADSAIELRRPRHAGGLNAEYRFADDRGQVSLAADYGGSRNDVFFPPWPSPAEIVSLSNYWVLDLTAQYALGDTVSLFARASNLLDAEYEQVFGYRTPGRAVYGGVRVEFGHR